MAVTIASSIGTAMVNATGRPNQKHLVYGVNNAKWYLFFLSSTNLMSLAYSSDFVTWNTSGTTLTLANAHSGQGLSFGFNYENQASTDVVHMASSYVITTTQRAYHARFTLNATSFSVSNAEAAMSVAVNQIASWVTGCVTDLDSAGKVIDLNPVMTSGSTFGNLMVDTSTNSDTTATWTAGFGTPFSTYAAAGQPGSHGLANLGGGQMLLVCDNNSGSGVMTDIEWTKGALVTWGTVAALSLVLTSTSMNNWGMTTRTTTDIHLVALKNNSNTFIHKRFNGTNWTTLSGAALPNLTLHATSGISLATDGTSVWAFAIDSSNNVQYIKWDGANWGSWTSLDTGGASARTNISAYPTVINSTIGVIWTQANGSNFDIQGTMLSLATPVMGVDWTPDDGISYRLRLPYNVIPY